MWLGVGLFASILCGTPCASWTCIAISFTKLGKFYFTIFSNRLPISCFFSYPSGTSMMQMLECLKLSLRLLTLSLVFWILFSSCSDWFIFASLCSKLLIWFSASSTSLLFPCKLFFISISVSFVSDWVFFMLLRSSLSSLGTLITGVLDCTSNRMLISLLFSSFSGILIY